ncbi:hypothetical protein KSP39_PZI021731 [Platanthera zijinensis]|uniref:Uncharacterized protein n=1 Tax=Platanthera zijinensis TaxID=2320716 RepID=A0AAP0FW40_9ASPA
MLCPFGEDHVSHRICSPYSSWKLEELASKCSIILLKRTDFSKMIISDIKTRGVEGESAINLFP